MSLNRCAPEPSPKKARADHGFRNIITRAVGIEPAIEPDVAEFEVRPGDTVLLCTDGLSNVVEENDIARTLVQAASPQAAADRLVQMANKNGGKDNITAVVARLKAGTRTLRMQVADLVHPAAHAGAVPAPNTWADDGAPLLSPIWPNRAPGTGGRHLAGVVTALSLEQLSGSAHYWFMTAFISRAAPRLRQTDNAHRAAASSARSGPCEVRLSERLPFRARARGLAYPQPKDGLITVGGLSGA